MDNENLTPTITRVKFTEENIIEIEGLQNGKYVSLEWRVGPPHDLCHRQLIDVRIKDHLASGWGDYVKDLRRDAIAKLEGDSGLILTKHARLV